MPILVRPVREQIEHDRVIRQLQSKWRRRFKVDANTGEERTASIKVGSTQLFPDLVLTTEGGKKPSAVVEVETGESVNHLEAMSQWASFAKSRIPFYLFVPGGSLDAARRLVTDHQIDLTELWTYFVLGDQIRFTSVFRSPSAGAGEPALDKIEKLDKLEKFDRPERVEPERVEKAEKTEKAEKAEKVEKVEKVADAEKPKAEKAARSEKAEKPQKVEPAPLKRREPSRAAAEAARPRRKAASTAAPRRKTVAAPKRAAALKRTAARGAAKRTPVRSAAAKARPAKRAAQKRR